MSNYIHYRSISSDHLSKSIIISESDHPPTWMYSNQFRNNTWPTPAMRTYESIICCDFAQYYWRQNANKREIMVKSLARELHHESGGKIYTSLPDNADMLHKQTVEEFKQIIKTKLVNQRYSTEELWNPNQYDSCFGSFAEGERVLATSLSGVTYEGSFQFTSVVNSNYCYIKFDSRNHIVCWDQNLVEHITLASNNNQRITRQMARRQRAGTSEQDAIVLSDDEATSDDSSINDEDNNSLDQNGMGVARGRTENNQNLPSFASSAINDRFIVNGNENNNVGFVSWNDEQISGSTSDQNNIVNDTWLTNQGYTINPMKDMACVICREIIPENQMIFDIKCGETLKHPLHTTCAQLYIAKKHTSCPVCRFLWKA